MQKLVLSDLHEKKGGKMVNFAGYKMPVQYTDGVIAEHQTVRHSVGVFDISHMGEVFISGKHSLNFLQYITTNDVSRLNPGQVQYTCFPNSTGGIVDDFLLYMMAENNYLLVINASNIEKDLAWINKHNSFSCTIDNQSNNYSLLAVQGPKATEALQALTDVDLSAIKFYHFEVAPMAGIDFVIISATGYTGSGGFEIYCKNSEVEQLWTKIFEAGAELGIKPIGLAARDTLRLEMGYCLYGNDIDDTTSPIEAGLGWITKFTKDFVNSKALLAQKENGPERKLVGFELEGRGIPRHGYDIVDADGNKVGDVTSGTMSPSLGKGIGLGYVNAALAKAESRIFIQVRKNTIPATVVKLPFYKG